MEARNFSANKISHVLATALLIVFPSFYFYAVPIHHPPIEKKKKLAQRRTESRKPGGLMVVSLDGTAAVY